MKFLKDLFAGVGNAHWDLGRILAALSLIAIIIAQAHSIFLGQALNVQAFGLALAAVLSGAGALIALKDRARGGGETPR